MRTQGRPREIRRPDGDGAGRGRPKTGASGRYVIEPLPGGDYAVGVNAESGWDREAYPTAIYSRDGKSLIPARVPVVEDAEVRDVNLVLAAKRIGTTLRVKVTAPDGAPAAGVVGTLENLDGAQRWYSRERTSIDGLLDLPVYVGERYVVRGARTDFRLTPEQSANHFEGTVHLDVTGEHPSANVVLFPKPAPALH